MGGVRPGPIQPFMQHPFRPIGRLNRRLPGCACGPMALRAAWRSVREPGERLVGWGLLLPGGRGLIAGLAFALGVLVPVLLPVSVLVMAWAYGSGRRLAVLTDRRLLLLRASRGDPRIEAVWCLGSVRVRAGRDADAPVRLRLDNAPASESVGGWFRPATNGAGCRFVQGLRAIG